MIYILSDTPIEGAKRLPLIKQRFLKPSIDFSSYDYLIVTSKNALVAASFLDPHWKKLPILAIGKGSEERAKALGAKVAYVAKKSYGEEFAKEIAARFDPKKHYLYLRGKKVLSNLASFLRQKGFAIDEAIVYETICQECEKLSPPPQGSTIIFSSPSTIECFFRCFDWDESYHAVAIGKKTASFFPYPIAVAPALSLKEAVAFAKSLRNSV